MEQYLTYTDYSLWQVILNGDGPIQVTTNANGVETEVPLKEWSTVVHGIKDAKSLWAAIKSRFGGNVKSKKMQKCFEATFWIPVLFLWIKFVEEPVEIMEREIKRLKRSRIPLVKVRWNSRRGPEFTWEREDSFKQKYPQLFTNRASSSTTRGLPSKVNKAQAVMFSASSAVTYTSVYTDFEPDRAFWGADDEEVSEGGIPQDEHVFPAEEQPLPPVDSPTAESHGYITESDPEEDPEEYEDDETKDGLVDYPMDVGDDGDDDDVNSSGDDADDKDEDEEDKEDEEEEEHLAPADSTIVVPTNEPVIPPPSIDITIGARITIRPQASISLPPEVEVERLMAMTTPSPSPPISLSPPSAGERLARCTAPPAHSSPPSVPSPLLPSSGCPTQVQTLRRASTRALIDAVTAALPSPLLPPPPYIPPPIDRRDDIPESEDTWIDPAEAVPEVAPMTVGEVNTRVTELAELHEHDTQDLYALLEDV
ncbi:hypothetical protein Tco_1246394 [Tanacetum coccineum]